ncbi:MAG: hypothetical protein JSW15_01365 [Deltaproteobacteria bacterium]|nr:MAG: hypothetical protein JSW15_01365 [Deltaproteobacteria bacterium]
MSAKATKWILFSVFLLIVPVPFYLVVVGGLVPTVFSIFLSLMAIAAVITKHDKESLYMLIILAPQAALFSSLFYFIAWAVSRVLRRVIPKRFMAAVVVGIVMAFVAASVFDIYRLPGHNSSPPGNILNILRGRS